MADYPPPHPAGWNWHHSYSQLPELFFVRKNPTPVSSPRLIVLNHALAVSLGLDPDVLSSPNHSGWWTGNDLPPGADPIAQAYAGHQFGHFTALGDGRAILLGEHLTPSKNRVDIQLKGAGRTPFSRGGDGRATLGPMLREYLISEAMHALGIPTTRSLAVATTGEIVTRESPLPGAVLTRVAASHIRVGTFQWAAAHRDHAALGALIDYTRIRHDPALDGTSNIEWFESIIDRQASLVAQWMLVGFIHGVMNTDNMAISGETIDYGPCAFIDTYDPHTVFSSIDHHGRYAYANQPNIALWNLTQLAKTLLPWLDKDLTISTLVAKESLATFTTRYHHHWLRGMRTKLGLINEEPDDLALAHELLDWMHQQALDYTQTFRHLTNAWTNTTPPEPIASSPWFARWSARLTRQPQSTAEAHTLMRSANPAVIPRNHLVEEALDAAVRHNDLSVMRNLLAVLNHPYDDGIAHRYTQPPPAGGPAYQTFCGT